MMIPNNLAQPFISTLNSIAWLFCGYLVFSTTFFFMKILSKLKNEVFNERLKIKPTSDRVILITGATSGIGLATAKYLYRRGFSIIATRLSENEPDHLTKLMLDESQNSREQVVITQKPKIFFVNLDVRFQDSISNSYIEVKKILKENDLKLHALINNAGVSFNNYTHWASRSQLLATVQVNLLGPILMVRQYTPLLATTPGSRVVNLGSILGQIPSQPSAYNATKAGLAMLSNCLTIELEHLKIKSIVVHVGNLIKNTAIIKNSSASIEQVYNELSDEEKMLYNEEYQKHAESLKKNDSFIEKSQSPTRIDENEKKKVTTSPVTMIARYLNFSGGTLDSRLDLVDTCLMRSFDNAICLKDPPDELYGGNWFYSIVTASYIESVSARHLKDLSKCFRFGANWQS